MDLHKKAVVLLNVLLNKLSRSQFMILLCGVCERIEKPLLAENIPLIVQEKTNLDEAKRNLGIT